MSKEISRRSFLKGAAASVAGFAALNTLGLAKIEANAESGTESELTDWLGKAPSIRDADCVETIDADVVVVGAGCAGMFAACAAAEQGAKTVLLEKFSVGTLSMRGFDMAGVGTKKQKELGIEIDRMDLLNDMIRYGLNYTDTGVIKAWIDNSGEALDWLDERMAATGNCDFQCEYNMPENTRYKAWPIGHCIISNVEGKEAAVFLGQELADYFTSFDGCQFLVKTPMQSLIKEDGKIVGVYAQNEAGEYIRVNASKGVIIATGGYGSNKEMYSALQPDTRNSLGAQLCWSTATGDGIKAALWEGAKFDNLHSTQVFDRCILGKDETTGDPWKYNGFQRYFHIGTQPFLKVNSDGKRITNESAPYDFIAHGAANYDGYWFQVFDSNWAEDVTRFHTVGCSTIIPAEGASAGAFTIEAESGVIDSFVEAGLCVKADTLEELADGLGINKENFLETVARYNELYDQQEDSDFGKEAFRLSALRQAPFYGAKLSGILMCTQDGIKTDINGQAYDETGKLIDGLFVVGNDAGNFYAHSYTNLGSGTNAGRCATFGRIAGKYVASL